MSMATDITQLPSQIQFPYRDKKNQDMVQGEGVDQNTLLILEGKIGIEAIEDKIVILTDKFRSGTECDVCDGTGIFTLCVCERKGHPNLNEMGRACSYCKGLNKDAIRDKNCFNCPSSCGYRILIPESTQSLPTSGIIVSVGPKCVIRTRFERVLYGAHTGVHVPFKGNVRLRIMREHEPLCLMHKIDPTATMEDFQLLQEPIDNVSGVK